MPELISQKDAVNLIAGDSIDNPYHRDYIDPNANTLRAHDIGELYDRQTTVAFVTMTALLTAIIAAIVIKGRK